MFGLNFDEKIIEYIQVFFGCEKPVSSIYHHLSSYLINNILCTVSIAKKVGAPMQARAALRCFVKKALKLNFSEKGQTIVYIDIEYYIQSRLTRGGTKLRNGTTIPTNRQTELLYRIAGRRLRRLT